MKSLLIRIAFIFLATGGLGWAQTGADDRTVLNGKWDGVWTSVSPKDAGYVYFASFNMTVQPDNSIEGAITWTIKASPRPEEQAKIGLTGTEYVHGVYDEASKMAQFEGYKKDDPNSILSLDKYRLILAPNNQVLGGITWSNGTWQGLISLSR
jgi:hypothetical protein